MKLLLNVQCFLALLPVARTEFVGLQRVEHAKNFIDITAYAQVVDGYVTNDIIGIHDKSGALANTFVRIEDAELVASSRFTSASIGNGRSFRSG